MASPDEPAERRFGAHLRQLDHWTFLLALGLVTANIVVGSRYVSAAASALLFVALGYDAYEFYSDS